MQLTARSNTESGSVVISDSPLGKGGEGSVFAVESHSLGNLLPPDELVAKIYHAPNEGDRLRKVVAMVKSPPDSDALAWPLAVLLNSSGSFCGYLMMKLPMDRYRMWASFTQGAERKRTSEKFDVRYALTAALNLAIALEAVHEAGHYVGDVNESNIFVGADASVLLVDTDSAQISTGDGTIFPCLVGKPEYTAAELTTGKLRDHRRTEASDTFAFAVAMYQLLMNGAHPTDGVYQGDGDPPGVVERIRAGVLPNLRKERGYGSVDRVPTAGMPNRLIPLFEAMLSPDAARRPPVHVVIETIEDVLGSLKRCPKVKQHWFDSRDRKCGWCEHVKRGQVDPWTLNLSAKKKREQKKLDSLKFGATEAPRARAARAPVTSPSPMMSAPASAPPKGAHAASGVRVPPASRVPSSARSSSSQRRALMKTQAAQGNVPPLSSLYVSSRVEMEKHKGKTVLQRPDGSSVVRPPLSELMNQRPALAYQCFVNELPSFARLHWVVTERVPPLSGLALGVLLAFGVSVVWGSTTAALLDLVPTETRTYLPWQVIYDLVPRVAVFTSFTAAISHALSGLMERLRIRRATGAPAGIFPALPVLVAAGRLVRTAFFYGPIFLVTASIGLILGVLTLLAGASTTGKRM